MKQRRIVERAGIDRERGAFADFAAEDETAADPAGIAYRVSAVCRFRYEFQAFAAEAHRTRGKADERNEARAGRLAAILAIAVAHIIGRAFGLITQRTAETTAAETRLWFLHCRSPASNHVEHFLVVGLSRVVEKRHDGGAELRVLVRGQRPDLAAGRFDGGARFAVFLDGEVGLE